MITYNNIDAITTEARGSVVAIGNFDGIHRGHQGLLNAAKKIARETGKKVGVLTFEPHPRALFQPNQPPARLTPAEVKTAELDKHGIDYLFSLPFDWEFASQCAEDFVQNVLIQSLGASHIIIGDNFCFGQLRKGNAQTIKDAGLPVKVITAIEDNTGETISSSRIRQLLRAGKVKEANTLLGWDWTIEGVIFRGDRRGHELGYPTANILLKDTIHPAYGIYACLVQIEDETEWLPAATNIGIRPMFEVPVGQVEAHILNFPDRDIYDKKLKVKPIKKLRGEAKFDSLEELITQMEKDCQRTLKILKSS